MVKSDSDALATKLAAAKAAVVAAEHLLIWLITRPSRPVPRRGSSREM